MPPDSRVAACPGCKICTFTHAVRNAQAAFGVLPSSVEEPVSVSIHTPDGRQVLFLDVGEIAQ